MKQPDSERIRIMTQLAIYDKAYGEADRRANSLFYRDYVYTRNFRLRLAAGVGVIIPFLFHFVFLFFTESLDLLHFDFVGYFVNMGVVIGLVMLVYTLLGTQLATTEYKNIKLRLQSYFSLMRELDALDEADEAVRDDDEDADDFPSIKYR